MRTFTSLEIRFEYVLDGKLPNRRIIRRKIRSCDSGIMEKHRSVFLMYTKRAFNLPNMLSYVADKHTVVRQGH